MRIAPSSVGAAVAVAGLLVWLAVQSGPGAGGGGAASHVTEAGPKAAGLPTEEREGASFLPCTVPMGWRIARVDPGFGLSHAEARAALEEAAALWEDAAGRALFTYDDEEGHPVRFVFDDRQQRTLERLRREREALDAGDPRERERLLEELARAFPPTPVEAGVHREAVVTEGGRVTSVGREIRVFQFEDRPGLVRLLAHELGHALGLGHSHDPVSVMSERYAAEGPRAEAPSVGPAEVAIIQERCP